MILFFFSTHLILIIFHKFSLIQTILTISINLRNISKDLPKLQLFFNFTHNYFFLFILHKINAHVPTRTQSCRYYPPWA